MTAQHLSTRFDIQLHQSLHTLVEHLIAVNAKSILCVPLCYCALWHYVKAYFILIASNGTKHGQFPDYVVT